MTALRLKISIFVLFILLSLSHLPVVLSQPATEDSSATAPDVFGRTNRLRQIVLDDSLKSNATDSPDTTTVLLRKADTTGVEQESDLDTTIVYEARIFDNDVENRKSYFIGDAVVKYKDITLKAARITLDWDKNLLIAEGKADTVWTYNEDHSDSTLTVKIIGEPVLIESGSQMVGEKMIYNFKSEKGRVIRGRTEFEGGHYYGQQIKRINDKVFNISYSNFTTCDLDSNPHYHFESRRLKMITNDKVIAKPVVMYLGHIPVAALPFAIFPHRTGRHSGIIIPRYGESTREGRYLRELGYYWAPNDYFDSRIMVDFFEKTGWLFRAGANYAIRYMLNGSISGSLTRKNFTSGYGDTYKSRRWDLRINHRQEIDPTSRFSASGFFVSDKGFYKDLSTNLNTRLTRELRSNATYTKSWPKHKLSLSVNVSQVHDLQDDVTQRTLPQMSFRKGQTQIFKPKKGKSRTPGGRRSRDQAKWYHSLYFSYNSNLLNSRREYLVKTEEDTSKDVQRTRHLSHNFAFSLNSPKKYFGWLALNQSLNIRDDWFDETTSYRFNPQTNQIESEKVKGFAARHTFNYSASANTKIYGLFAPGIADIQAIRHVITPSLSFRYQPDFSDPAWGYYTEVRDANGTVVKKDRFGGTPSGGSQFINLNVRNLFQMKKGYGENEKKIDLFTMDFSTGFNYKAKSYRLADLRTSWRANPARNFSLSASTTHSFYAWDEQSKSLIHKYLFDDGGWMHGQFMRLTNFRLNFSIRLQSKRKKTRETGQEPEEEMDYLPEEAEGLFPGESELDVLEEEDLMRQGNRFTAEQTFRKLDIPWRVNLNFNFSLDKRRDPNNPVKRYYLDVTGAEVKLTRNWRIGYSARYDLAERIVTHHRFTFYRDLHCWEAQIDWVPSGYDKRFYFRINIKAPALRDIKLERRGGRAAGVLGY